MIDVITGLFGKLTQPEVKFIRTLEGILVVIFNLALGITTLLVNLLTNNPHLLPPATVAKILVVINGVAVIARTALKMVLAIQAKTPTALLGAPPQPRLGFVESGNWSTSVGANQLFDNPQQEIDAYLEEQTLEQEAPGTPADQVVHGLNPTPTPASKSAGAKSKTSTPKAPAPPSRSSRPAARTTAARQAASKSVVSNKAKK